MIDRVRRHGTEWRTACGAALAAIALGLVTGEVAAQQDFSWSGSVDRGDAVTIRGVNGPITARAASGGQVRVMAVKTAERDEPESVSIEVIEDSEGVLICAIYPSRRAGRANRCARGDEYRNNTNNNDVEVAFTVEVPAGVELDAITVNGDIDVTDLTGAVHAVTVNGDVTIDTNGSASATTVNGDIDARMGRLDDDVEFTTVNGGITLTMPSGISADVEATTVNGNIETDFPITIRGRWGPRSARGEFGGGGATLEATTVNGSIRLRRS